MSKRRGLSEDQERAIVAIYEELSPLNMTISVGPYKAARGIVEKGADFMVYPSILTEETRNKFPRGRRLGEVLKGVSFYSVLNVLRRHIAKPKYRYVVRGSVELDKTAVAV